MYTLKSRHADEALREMEQLADSEARVFLLYCNKEEASYIMRAANQLGLTGRNYIWVVTQSVIGQAFDNAAPADFPTGLLGKIICNNFVINDVNLKCIKLCIDVNGMHERLN